MDSHAFILHQVNLCRNLWLTNFSLQRGGGGSDDTVSKGLQQLVVEEKILNVPGGAISPFSLRTSHFKKNYACIQKKFIAQKAALLIHDVVWVLTPE